jgi:retron-type reverse transcriptase
MKRHGNLYERICDIQNIYLADDLASKGKGKQFSVVNHKANRDMNLLKLQTMLLDKTFKTSPYTVFKVYEPKEREVYRLPYFPDRIVHHAIMNVLESIFINTFTTDTYSCIKGMGLHKASRRLSKALKNVDETKYCLKLDIRKFYPSVDHDILKSLLRRKFKDNDLLNMLDEIIDSADGIPIGNYLSQYFANFYLTYFDHWLKEELKVKYYYRYADDIVILHSSKDYLHGLLSKIRIYLNVNLKLKVKGNYQVFPVASRGIDFLGYVHYHTHTILRKSIKQRFAIKVKKDASKPSIASYLGWAKHANCKNLIKKLLPEHEKV